MSTLVIGLSHHSAPVAVLERVAPGADEAGKLLVDAATAPYVREAVLLATCNRVEVYADVERFHGAIEGLAEVLARYSGLSLTGLIPHLYVRYEEAAVSHLFGVASGLDSMVVGESQILGQVKAALRQAQDAETIGSTLNPLLQRALRVGKRVHSETGVGRAGQSVVSVALDLAGDALAHPSVPEEWPDGKAYPASTAYDESVIASASLGQVSAPGSSGLSGVCALVIGAGSMAALAGTHLRRDHRASLVVANRTLDRARTLATSLEGTAIGMAALSDTLAEVDLIVSCTGAIGTVVSAELLDRALPAREERPLVIVDLALPRDVDEEVRQLPGVTLVDLAGVAETMRTDASRRGLLEPIEEARRVVADEVEHYIDSQRAASVVPTVVALRTMAEQVVDAELRRLQDKLPSIEAPERAEVEKTVRRVVEKLLHAPTIRVKELGGQKVDSSYADALRELFALDQATVEAVSEPQVPGPVLDGQAAPAEPAESSEPSGTHVRGWDGGHDG